MFLAPLSSRRPSGARETRSKGGLQPLKLPPGRYETRGSPGRQASRLRHRRRQRSDRVDLRSVRCELDAPAHGARKKSLSDLVRRRRKSRVPVRSRRRRCHFLAARRWHRARRTPHQARAWDFALPGIVVAAGRQVPVQCVQSEWNVTVSLWTFSLRDRKAEPFGGVQLSTANLARSVFSPDGRWVAYMSDETGMTACTSSQSRRQAPSIRSRKVGPPLPCGCRMERESFTLIRKPHLQEAQEDSSS